MPSAERLAGAAPSRCSLWAERPRSVMRVEAEGEMQLEEAAALYKGLGAKAELGETYMRLSKSADGRGDAANAQKYAGLAYRTTKKKSGLVER